MCATSLKLLPTSRSRAGRISGAVRDADGPGDPSYLPRCSRRGSSMIPGAECAGSRALLAAVQSRADQGLWRNPTTTGGREGRGACPLDLVATLDLERPGVASGITPATSVCWRKAFSCWRAAQCPCVCMSQCSRFRFWPRPSNARPSCMEIRHANLAR